MDIETLLTDFVIVVFACIIVAFGYNIVRYKGLKGAIFGAPIRRTVGELEISRRALSSIVVRVHVLGGDASKEVGLEVVSKSPLSYHMEPFSFSRNDASALARLLEHASVARDVQPRDPAA